MTSLNCCLFFEEIECFLLFSRVRRCNRNHSHQNRVCVIADIKTVRDKKKGELLIISVTKNENIFWLGFCTWRLTCILFLVAKENITLLALRCYGDGRHLEKMRIDKFLPMCCGLKTMNVAFGFILTQSNLVPLEREWLHLSNSCIFVWFRASYIM